MLVPASAGPGHNEDTKLRAHYRARARSNALCGPSRGGRLESNRDGRAVADVRFVRILPPIWETRVHVDATRVPRGRTASPSPSLGCARVGGRPSREHHRQDRRDAIRVLANDIHDHKDLLQQSWGQSAGLRRFRRNPRPTLPATQVDRIEFLTVTPGTVTLVTNADCCVVVWRSVGFTRPGFVDPMNHSRVNFTDR